MPDYFDELETREPEDRAETQFAALRATLVEALESAPGLALHLDGLDPDAVTDRAALARLPVLRKADLAERQRADPPFGGLTTRAAHTFPHVFQSPGPIYEPGMDTPDWWRFGRALYAAGVRAGDVLHNTFAYHLTPAGHMVESGARALGAAVIPGGTGNTEAQVTAAHDIGATAYSGTPDFLKTMLERAEALERPLSIARALVSGGPLFASLREDYGRRGIACLQCYATADLGLIAYETHENGMPHPGMVVDEGVIVEILRPGTGDPVPDGEVGEVVVTTLNSDYPLVRFATGDLSSVLPGPSPCGRTNMRIRGWMGRADQTTKVKGMFVRPEQIAAILARHPGVLKGRLTVSREAEQDRMTLTVETAEPSPDLAAAVAETMRDVLKLRGDVEADIPGSLPNDGKVIDDIRKFD